MGVACYRITVTELPPEGIYTEQWRIEWRTNLGDMRHIHDSKKAAQRHVANLLKDLAPGLTKDDVLTVNRLRAP